MQPDWYSAAPLHCPAVAHPANQAQAAGWHCPSLIHNKCLHLSAQAYTMVQHIVYEHTSLLYNRHLDQILLSALYGVCKVRSGF